MSNLIYKTIIGVHKSTSAPRPQNGEKHDTVSAQARSATVSTRPHTNSKNCEDGNNSGYDSGVEVSSIVKLIDR